MYGIGQGGAVPIPGIPSSMYSQRINIPSFNFNNHNNGDITDTREFIKKTFSANIKTRDVEDVAKKIELLIKGLGGRIDNSNITNTYATFSFVIPKSKLDDFESQIRSYVHKKLYSQTITSQNLLEEKQNLEHNQGTTKESIASLATERQQVQTEYTKKANELKSKISTKNSQARTTQNNITKKEDEVNTATNTTIKTEKIQELVILQKSEDFIIQEISSLTADMNNLSNAFKVEMSRLGASIEDQNNVLVSLDEQTDSFLNKVETVQGTIYISYITIWGIITVFSPISPLILLIIIFVIGRLIVLNKQEKKLLELQK
jgi:Fe2+ transport system protein B